MAKITNNGQGIRIVNAIVDGRLRQVPVAPGETRDLELLESKGLAAAAKAGRVKIDGAYATAPAEAASGRNGSQGGNGSGNGTPGAYAVTEQSQGWYAVTDASGKAVTKNFRKADLAEFDGMSDTDKAAFVDLHKPE